MWNGSDWEDLNFNSKYYDGVYNDSIFSIGLFENDTNAFIGYVNNSTLETKIISDDLASPSWAIEELDSKIFISQTISNFINSYRSELYVIDDALDINKRFNLNISRNDFKVYPNPFTNTFVISTVGRKTTFSKNDFQLLNLLGEKVDFSCLEITKNSIVIDGSQLQKGIYILEVEGVGRTKIVKE